MKERHLLDFEPGIWPKVSSVRSFSRYANVVIKLNDDGLRPRYPSCWHKLYTQGVLRTLDPETTWRIRFVRAMILVRCGEHNLRSSSAVKFLTRG